MLKHLCVAWLAVLLTLAPGAWAGESGLNVIVVVNQNSTNSLQLGNDYCERRGVPPQSLFRMTGWTGSTTNWQQSDFENYLLNPLLAMISSRGLTNQAEIILLSMDIPYRVYNGDSDNGTTSALFYGFKTNTAPPPGLPDTCSLPDDTTNSYSYSELPFTLAEPETASTEGAAHGELFAARGSATELEVGKIYRNDKENETDRAPKDNERALQLTGDVVFKGGEV